MLRQRSFDSQARHPAADADAVAELRKRGRAGWRRASAPQGDVHGSHEPDGIARLVGLAGREWDAVERWQDARGVRLLLEPEIVAVELLAAGDLSPLTSYQRRRGGAASSARTVAAVAAVSAARRS